MRNASTTLVEMTLALTGCVALMGAAASTDVGESVAQPEAPAASIASPRLMDRASETALALSACPPPVASGAAVYVLERSGYVRVRESQNGFTAIVQHSLPTSQEPQCMDAEGTRTLLPRLLKVAELRAQGRSADEIRAFVARAFVTGVFRPPGRPGVDYMLSTHNLIPNSQGIVTPFPPHVMFYAPYLTNADLGLDGSLDADGNPRGRVFVAGEGTPQALIIVPLAAREGHLALL